MPNPPHSPHPSRVSHRPRLSWPLSWCLASLLVVTLLAPPAIAQTFMRQGAKEEWTLVYRVSIRAWQDHGSVEQGRAPRHDVFTFEQASVVVPVLESTSIHRVQSQDVEMRVWVDGQPAKPADSRPFRWLPNKHAGSRWAMWAIGEGRAREIRAELRIPMTSYAVTVDERAARAVEWPQGDWPQDAASALEPQIGVELSLDGEPYEHLDRVAERIDRVIESMGRDARSIPPYLVAKYLTGAVWSHLRTRSGLGVTFARTGEIEGIELHGVPETFGRRRGNDFDACALLVYTLRRAGLPARLVVGVISESEEGRESVITQDDDEEDDLHCWVEFALVERGRTAWIPIDFNEMMDASTRAPDFRDAGVLMEPWEGFGTLDDSERYAPFTHHFHPPLTVRAYGSPGFWGLFATPAEPSRADQAITFDVTSTPKTAGQNEQDQGGEPTPRRRRR